MSVYAYINLLVLAFIICLLIVIAVSVRQKRSIQISASIAEKALKEQEELFRALMEYCPIYIFFKDENIRAIHLSKSYEKMLGRPINELLGKMMDDLFPSDLAKSMIEDDKRILREGKPVEIIEKFGDATYSTVKFPVSRAGAPPFLAGFTFDITERIRIADELKRSKTELELANRDLQAAIGKAGTLASKAEAANIAKTYFMANMSHELRTPLNGIIGFSHLLKCSAADDDQKLYVEMIKSSSAHLLNIINDILDFSGLEAGRLKLDVKPFRIVDVVRTNFDEITRQASRPDQKYSFEAAPGLENLELIGDPVRVVQIVSNFLTNAVKFTGAGRISLFIDETERRGNISVVTIAVEDTGPGIPPDKHREIFEMFHQLDSSTTKKFEGTGLGLAIVKGIVEMMKGEIELKSEVGRGSRFSVKIPFEIASERVQRAAEAAPAPGKAEPPAKTVRPIKILLADDDETSRNLICEYANIYGWEVDGAEDGKKALEMHAAGDYEVILMDGQMKVMDGFEATRRIRRAEAGTGKHVPIIAITAYALSGDRERFIAAGTDDYISKPIDSDALDEMVKKYTRK